MNQAIEGFIQGKRIAVVGVSRSGQKFGNIAYQELKSRGYQVFPVHPEAQELAGDRCYPNLAALQGQVDGVLVCVPAQPAEAVLREAAQAGLKKVWLQQGAETPQLLELGKSLGLELVSGKCILMYASPVTGLHGLHRGFAKIFGQL